MYKISRTKYALFVINQLVFPMDEFISHRNSLQAGRTIEISKIIYTVNIK